jgi:protein-tyrosine-phosphatase/DNA-binding MarR family transcriptional regulator
MGGVNEDRDADRRAAIFAALGDPVRLSIVDRLVPGDASPGDLAAELRLGSNLLAHHLHVLQEAGVIRRTRSEADRRRSYVQLRLDHPTVWAAAITGKPGRNLARAGRLVFVCTANSARSQLAAATWNQLSTIPATSAGTHPGPRIHPRALTTARRHGLHLAADRPIGIADQLRDGDLIVAVCDKAHEELSRSIRRLHWSIPDPVPLDTDPAFEEAYTDITRRVHHLAAVYDEAAAAS